MIRNRTAILALLTGLNLLNYIDRMTVAAVLKRLLAPDDAHRLEHLRAGGLLLTNFEGGLLATAFLGGYFATAPWFGARADRGTRKTLIALGVAVWSAATFATGLAHTFGQLIAARIVVGVGEASYATLAPTIIDDITPPESKARALAIFYLAIPVGSALGYLIGGFIDAHWGWRYAFYVTGAPGLLLAVACLAIEEPERTLRAQAGTLRDGLRTIARLAQFRRGTLGYCAYTGAIGAFSYWAPKYLADRYSDTLTNATANYYFGLVTVVAGTVGTLAGGRWADRALARAVVRSGGAHTAIAWDAPAAKAGTNALLRVCGLSTALAVPFVVACFLMPTAMLFFAAAFVAEIFLFLSTSPVSAIGLRAVPPELRASAMAAMIFAIHLFGDLWSPSVLGLLKDTVAPVLAMMVVPLVFAWAAYLWWPRAREARA